MKIAILGAGVSGLTAGRLLKDKGYDVTIYERSEKLGGLAKSRITDGYTYDPHGGHIFNSKHKEVTDWIFSLLPNDEWQYSTRNAKIYFNGKYISYPFELSLCELDIDDAADCLYDFILSKQGDEPDNFRDWIIWNFGKAIADYYMIPYNEKIWAYPLEKMETKWMQGKMPLPTKKEIIRSLLLKDPSERKMPHSTFYYPLKGGIQTMVNAISKGLNIKLNNPVKSIKKLANRWVINGGNAYDNIISTIPLPLLPYIMELPAPVNKAINNLKHNSLTTILFDCHKTDISWLYIPSHEYRVHRIGYQSSLTPYACPQTGEGSAALEIIGKQFSINDNLINSNILPEKLGFRRVIDSEFTEYAYVIHDLGYRKNTTEIFSYFNKEVKGFELLGRWGTWNYNNMDICMHEAFQLVEKWRIQNDTNS